MGGERGGRSGGQLETRCSRTNRGRKKIDGSGVEELEKGNKWRQRKRRGKKVSEDRIVPKGVKYENEKK